MNPLAKLVALLKAGLTRLNSLADPVSTARADEEAYLSQAVDLAHLEALQRSWDRHRGQAAWRLPA